MRTIDPRDPAITYAAVLDALPIVAYMANPAGEITYVSRAWERFTGNRADDVIGDGYRLVIHPEDLAQVQTVWDEARAGGAGYRDEFRLRFGDGSFRWVLSQADPLRHNGDDVIGWVGTLTDIHGLRLAEHGLARALEAAAAHATDADARAHFVERLLEASDDCVKVLDLQGRIVSMSANGQKALGIRDFASVAESDWFEFWAGDDRAAALTAFESARNGGRGRFTGLYAVEERDKWWDVTLTPILGGDGTAEQVLAVSRDVTDTVGAHRDLARSEAHYRVLREALPGVTWTALPDGRLDFVSGPASPTYALVDAPMIGDAWLDTVHPDDRERVRSRWATAIAGGEPYETQFRVLRAGGEYRWQLVRAQAQRDENGAILRWVGVNVDVEDQRRIDDAREQFVRLAEASDDFIAIVDAAGAVTYVNDAARRLLDIESLADAGETTMLDFFAAGDRDFVTTHILPAIARDGHWLGENRLRNFRSGAVVPVWYNAFALVDDAGRTTGIAAVARDLRERIRIEAGLRALAEAGAAMYESLDFTGTMRNIADAVARTFAAYCTVTAIDAEHKLRSVAAAQNDPAAVAVIERAISLRKLPPEHPVNRALERGESTLVETVPDDWMDAFGVRAVVGNAMDRLDLRSMIFVPIRSAQVGQVFGALACIMNGQDARGSYTAEDLRFAQEVAVRAGLALDHARAYERERRIAVTLQEASLPGVLPQVDHLFLSADYRPGNSEATIGGDWYDAFLLDDGRVAFSVGDVLGKGLNAAVTMGKVRQAIRAIATVLPDPNSMLDVADRTIRAVSADTYATAMVGIFDLGKHEYTFASAGHPGPAVRRGDGSIEEYTSPGLLLGLRPRGETNSVIVATPPGSALVFYTDGLVEATRDIDEGHRRLHAAMADPAVASAANPAHALVEHVLDAAPATDDIAVLVVEVGPSLRFDALMRTAAARAAKIST